MGLNLVAAILLFGGLPLAVVLLARLSGRRTTLILSLVALAVMGALMGLRLWGTAVLGVIRAKSETINLARRGLAPSAVPRLVLTVAEGPSVLALSDPLRFDVTERLFDRVRQGQQIPLHEVRFGPFKFARLDAEPWWDLLAELLRRCCAPRIARVRARTEALRAKREAGRKL